MKRPRRRRTPIKIATHRKNCSEHGENMPAYFVKRKDRAPELICKLCSVLAGRFDYQKYKEKRLATRKAYRERNREKCLEYWRAYRAKYKDQINMDARVRNSTPERRKLKAEQARQRYLSNIEASRAKYREYYEKNRERIKERARLYREAQRLKKKARVAA